MRLTNFLTLLKSAHKVPCGPISWSKPSFFPFMAFGESSHPFTRGQTYTFDLYSDPILFSLSPIPLIAVSPLPSFLPPGSPTKHAWGDIAVSICPGVQGMYNPPATVWPWGRRQSNTIGPTSFSLLLPHSACSSRTR